VPKLIFKKGDLALRCCQKLLEIENEPCVLRLVLYSCSRSVEVGLWQDCVRFVMQFVIWAKHYSLVIRLTVSLFRYPDKRAPGWRLALVTVEGTFHLQGRNSGVYLGATQSEMAQRGCISWWTIAQRTMSKPYLWKCR